jgi:hypothetical protein
MGILHEISGDAPRGEFTAKIYNNKVGLNGRRNRSLLYDANIMVSTSSDTDVAGNYIEVAESYGQGLTVLWQDRVREGIRYEARNNRVHDNTIVYLGRSGHSGAGWSTYGSNPARQVFEQNHFYRNRYFFSQSSSDKRFAWKESSSNSSGFMTTLRTFSDAQSKGMEVTDANGNPAQGSVSRNVSPIGRWSCDLLE